MPSDFAFVFAYIGHAAYLRGSLNLMGQPNANCSRFTEIQFYDMEAHLREISKYRPVVAFMNSNRLLLTREPSSYANKAPPKKNKKTQRLAMVYMCQTNKSVRGLDCTDTITQHLSCQMDQQDGFMLPASLKFFSGCGQMETMLQIDKGNNYRCRPVKIELIPPRDTE